MSDAQYSLLDSGNGRKLERVGPHILNRQAPHAFWAPSLEPAAWDEAVGIHVRKKAGGGYWNWKQGEPTEWVVEHGGQQFIARPTPFGHLGLFAEQDSQWEWIREAARSATDTPLNLLNLFAYTGGSTLAAASVGAHVTHVDAAKGVVDWARKNQSLNELGDASIRWIVDDCQGFLDREVRRGRKFDGLILDPPTFGRGKNGEIWKIEEHLLPLIETCTELIGPSPSLLLLTAHTPGFGGLSLQRLVESRFSLGNHQAEQGEMYVQEASGTTLPSGAFARWRIPL